MAEGVFDLFIDQIPGETRVALLNNDELQQVFINQSGFSDTGGVLEGSIYLGRVVNVVPSLQAAFVDLGIGENGFLPVNATYEQEISKAVHVGEAVLVQVRKAATEDKGPALSCKIDLTSDHLVLTPGRSGVNVSRKFKDENKRKQVSKTLGAQIPDDIGLIVRTSAENQLPESLKTEAENLLQQWRHIQNCPQTAPALKHTNKPFLDDLLSSALSDLSFEKVLVDGINALHQVKQHHPEAKAHPALFETFHIEEQIEEALNGVIPLEGGGDIRIERTRALIAIDVNMGDRMGSGDIQDNILKANLAALNAIFRQIVLRNLSGQIVIDFINQKRQSHRDRLLDSIKNTFQTDKRSTVHGFTRLGLCEITRSRKGYGLDEIATTPLSHVNRALRAFAAQTGLKSLRCGQALYDLWQSDENQITLNWLEARLGYRPKAGKDISLSPYSYIIEDTKQADYE